MPIRQRPRRSNQSLSIVRGIKTLKVYYWTTARLRKLLPGVFRKARQEHFAKAVRALKAWPLRSKEQILDDASRINPLPLMDGRWLWPNSVLMFMREYADRAPEDGIDTDKLRKVLAGMDDRTRERFMELVIESLPEAAEETMLESGPAPREIGIQTLRRLRRMQRWLGWNDSVPRANPTSPMGWD
jgi:hypothetical protein